MQLSGSQVPERLATGFRRLSTADVNAMAQDCTEDLHVVGEAMEGLFGIEAAPFARQDPADPPELGNNRDRSREAHLAWFGVRGSHLSVSHRLLSKAQHANRVVKNPRDTLSQAAHEAHMRAGAPKGWPHRRRGPGCCAGQGGSPQETGGGKACQGWRGRIADTHERPIPVRGRGASLSRVPVSCRRVPIRAPPHLRSAAMTDALREVLSPEEASCVCFHTVSSSSVVGAALGASLVPAGHPAASPVPVPVPNPAPSPAPVSPPDATPTPAPVPEPAAGGGIPREESTGGKQGGDEPGACEGAGGGRDEAMATPP